MDAPIDIVGSWLPVDSKVVLKTTLICPVNKLHYESINAYMTDGFGAFSTSTTPPLPGSHYTTIHGSGPLWSVRKQPQSRDFMYWVKNPFQYNLELFSDSRHKLGETVLWKTFNDPSVTRVGVDHGNVQGCLYLPHSNPSSQQKTKGIITVDGAVGKGRVNEARASLLASKGFVTFALAFFGCKGQPKIYNKIFLEEIEESVDFVRNLPEVEDKRIGLVGRSRGGDICMALAAFLGDKIGATVCINNPFASMPGDTVYKAHVIKGTDFRRDVNEFKMVGGGEAFGEDPSRQVPVELIKGPVLSIQGGDDSFARDFDYQKCALTRAKRARKLNFEAVVYPGKEY